MCRRSLAQQLVGILSGCGPRLLNQRDDFVYGRLAHTAQNGAGTGAHVVVPRIHEWHHVRNHGLTDGDEHCADALARVGILVLERLDECRNRRVARIDQQFGGLYLHGGIKQVPCGQ